MVYENYNQLTMMIWELNPKKRNDNNIIKVNSKVDLSVGDTILGDLKMDISISEYIVTEILDVRQSSMKGYKYYTLKITFKYASAQKYINSVSSKTSGRINSMVAAKEEEESKKKKLYHVS